DLLGSSFVTRDKQRRETPGGARLPPVNQTFSTCAKSSSTGVARRKSATARRTWACSYLTSSTEPLKSVNGPSLMRTISPTSHCTLGRGFSTPSCICETIFITSASEIGDGRVLAPPTNPVTLLVCLTRCQVSSPISISTRTYPGKKRRSLTDFLPFFSSTTSSIGTRMRPNFSFISERSMRSRRLRSTAFSMPEQAWTTYQRLPGVGANDSGVTGASVVAVMVTSLALPAEDQVVEDPLE